MLRCPRGGDEDKRIEYPETGRLRPVSLLCLQRGQSANIPSIFVSLTYRGRKRKLIAQTHACRCDYWDTEKPQGNIRVAVEHVECDVVFEHKYSQHGDYFGSTAVHPIQAELRSRTRTHKQLMS